MAPSSYSMPKKFVKFKRKVSIQKNNYYQKINTLSWDNWKYFTLFIWVYFLKKFTFYRKIRKRDKSEGKLSNTTNFNTISTISQTNLNEGNLPSNIFLL